MAKARTVSATDFKARCLGLLDEVAGEGLEVVVTKRGKPLARLTPIRVGGSLRGVLKGRLRIKGDIVRADWRSDFEAVR